MKINERLHFDDATDTLTTVATHDVGPVLESVKRLQSAGLTGNIEKRHVGRVPMAVLEAWVREAGVRFDDHQAVKEVMHKKLLSGEFNGLRPWGGTY